MASNTDKSKPYIPLAGVADDGWSKEDSATATCYCGAVQLAFPTQGPGLLSTFVCHCTDCRKITASMFTSAFSIRDTHLTHIRGRDNLTAYGQSRTIASGNQMTNYFCSTCGTLMYRIGSPGASILRVGTVDDFHLHETKLKPQSEIFVKDRVCWLSPIEGPQQYQAQRPPRHLRDRPTEGNPVEPNSPGVGLTTPKNENKPQPSQQSNYTMGHSEHTVSNHQLRTAESEAAFLLPYIKKTDRILDVGCGPGTITTTLAKYASEGSAVGIDISSAVLQKAKTLAAEASVPTEGPGSVVFEEGNILERLAYPDDTFDVVFSSHLFGHLPVPNDALRALTEMRRVLKPGGILASRNSMEQHFYPRSLDLDRLWGKNLSRGLHKGESDADPTGTRMPALFRQAGFDAEGGKIHIGTGSAVFSGPETRKRLALRAEGQLKKGDPFHQSWLDAGITEDEIQQTLDAVEKWAETEDAYFASLQSEMLAWK